MTHSLHHQVDVTVRPRQLMKRRHFLRSVSLAGAAAGTLSWPDLMALEAAELRERGRACILLWMQGGPSQFETFSPKPGHENGGETKAISTCVPGVEISENLPKTATAMDEVCLIRSMNSREGSHPRATYLMHTGYLPTASIKHPTIGSNVVHQLADRAFDLPSFVRIGNGRGGAGAGLLGVEFDPFVMTDPKRMPDNTELMTDERRYRRRVGLLSKLEQEYANSGGEQEVNNQRKLYEKASKLVLSPKMNAFDIEREPAGIREAYGSSNFAAGCLLARRLVETGVTFVEVSLGNWDNHQNVFEDAAALCQQMDQPYAALLKDLRERGMLDNTLVIWAGEFGRTPTINGRGGRDHYPRAFNIALAGGGVRGGQVIGSTDAGGTTVEDRPVGVADLLRTVCHSLKIDADHEHMSSIGRPIKIVDGGDVVSEVFG
ncbi:MAG: DUF1501 domain-containing protein [Planctomycetales bacterium]|nr:DUF1501 domain-containing protein [Planctomycetales bacterium]